MGSLIVKKGEIAYLKNREQWEKAHAGRIIAIDVDAEEVAGVGGTIDEALDDALRRQPGKQFYVRKVGPCGAAAYLYDVIEETSLPYEDGMPVAAMVVSGPKGQRQYRAYLDTGAAKCLIPETDALELGLDQTGEIEVVTGTGKDDFRTYRALIHFLDKDFSLHVLARDFPDQSSIRALVGKDILDHFEVRFEGPAKRVRLLVPP